jgi:uncharacterized protein (TIGR03067 family)
MLRRCLAVGLAAALSTVALTHAQSAAPAQAAKPKPGAIVQGTWLMTTSDGQDMSGSGQTILITVTGTTYTQAANGTVVERGSFKLDESKKPMTIDLNIVEGSDAGQVQLGVLEVVDGVMRGKLTFPGGTTRPTDLAPSEGYITFTAKKQ